MKKRHRVLHGASFVEAVRADVRYLIREDRDEWVALLDEDLQALERLLAELPRAGTLMHQRGRRELRKLRLRRTPFVVWYACEPANVREPLVLLHLFHVRQKSRIPRGW